MSDAKVHIDAGNELHGAVVETNSYIVNISRQYARIYSYDDYLVSAGVVAPTAQPTSLTFSNVTQTTMDVSFTASVGGADGYVAFRRTGASPTFVPVDTTTYTVGSTYGDSTCQHFGAGVTFSETGLSASTTYYYDIFAWNGAVGTYVYLTTSPLEGSQTTSAPAFAFGNAIHLNGSNNYGTIATSTSFFGGKTAFKLNFWVYFDVSLANQAIIWDGNSGVTNGFSMRTGSSNSIVCFFGAGTPSQTATIPAASIGAGAWRHVSLVYNGAGSTNADKVQVAVDGVAQTLSFSGTIPSSIGNSTVSCIVGARTSTVNFLNGWLDEMCLWTDTTGSDTYNGGAGAAPTATNLQNYWKFNESNSATVADDDQNANDITFTNLTFDADSGWGAH